jgi:hypothetical protein
MRRAGEFQIGMDKSCHTIVSEWLSLNQGWASICTFSSCSLYSYVEMNEKNFMPSCPSALTTGRGESGSSLKYSSDNRRAVAAISYAQILHFFSFP